MKFPIDPASLSPLIAGLFRLWIRTIRFNIHGDVDSLLKANDKGTPYTAALWHGELFPLVGFATQYSARLVAFVSQSKDGEVIARVLERLGHGTVRGSSSRGGVKALLRAIKVMKSENKVAVFAVDGPRGPRYKTKDGVIFMSQRAGAKIIPLRAYPKSVKRFEKAWDKFMIPYPFSQCDVYVGEPISITEEKLDKETMAREKERLNQRLMDLGPDE